MKISVVVPVYNNPDGLKTCLKSLSEVDDPDFEVIVVDDASPTSHEDVCAMFGARFVRLHENAGPGVARNEGARLARGEILAFTDSDCAVPRDWLSKIRGAFRSPEVVAVAGTFDRNIGDTFFCRLRLLEASFYHIKERCLVNSFTTSNFAVRASVFRDVGGFPPLRVAEDLLLGYKLMRAGYGVLWLYDLRVAQQFRPSLWKYFTQQMEWMANVFRVTMQHPDVQVMKWSVQRSGLVWQLGIQTLLIGTAPLYPSGGTWILAPILGLGALVGLNYPFLRFCTSQRSLGFAIRVWLAIVLVRNTAWLVGLGWASLRNPLRACSSVGYLLLRQIRRPVHRVA